MTLVIFVTSRISSNKNYIRTLVIIHSGHLVINKVTNRCFEWIIAASSLIKYSSNPFFERIGKNFDILSLYAICLKFKERNNIILGRCI